MIAGRAGSVAARDAGRLLGEAVGRTISPLVMPRRALRVLGSVPARLGDRWPDRVPMCSEMLRTLLAEHRHDGDPAAEELGFRYRPIDDIIARAVAWYREQGLV